MWLLLLLSRFPEFCTCGSKVRGNTSQKQEELEEEERGSMERAKNGPLVESFPKKSR